MENHLIFDTEKYEIRVFETEEVTIRYRAFEDIVYCTKPVDPIQKMNIYAPEIYFEGGSINGYTLRTAPIFLPNSVGGYMSGPAETPGRDMKGHINTLVYALAHGYVVASIGVRGRETADRKGKAPALLVDEKAGIRYLKYNRDLIPGDAEHMITNGTSAGGALSAMTGSSGDHPDFASFLEDIGAADASDAIFASNCYCPIHNLEHADIAYEWLFRNEKTYHGMKIEKTPEGMKFTPLVGELTSQQLEWSKELADAFPEYVNGLQLKDDDGRLLTLDDNGEGTFRQYVFDEVKKSAQKALENSQKGIEPHRECVPGSEIIGHSAVKFCDGNVVSIDEDAYISAITRMKAVPAFDSIGSVSPEDSLFGNEEADARHFTKFSQLHDPDHEDMADQKTIDMVNPLHYLKDPNAQKALHFRIRHGSYDRDTSMAIPVILALSLKNAGIDVDFHLPWGMPHRGDYDLSELFSWIDRIVKE